MRTKTGAIALGHIGLTVSDLDVSEGFYQEVLGFRVVDESLQFPSRYASMGRDGKTVLTLWEDSGGRIKKRLPGLHHLAFEAESVEEVNRTKGLLDSLGAHWIEGGRIYPEGSRGAAIHFHDPDGIRIELYSTERLPALEQDSGFEMAAEEIGLGNVAAGILSNPQPPNTSAIALSHAEYSTACASPHHQSAKHAALRSCGVSLATADRAASIRGVSEVPSIRARNVPASRC